ncbi:SDR family oxidoreductase [Candidatus Gottesmanbacteria bacterium]|nr:SDR family oxidoreductase [Candidatus Gottesmanbacteria bacterium]
MTAKIKCLVTGGAGFIGSHLCDKLIEKRYEVVCLDNLITGNKENLRQLLNNPNFHFVQHDVVNPFTTKLDLLNQKIQYIYHLASPASPPQYRKYSIETLLTNSSGTYNVLELARKMKAFYLLASTSEVYGNPIMHPQKESYFGNVNPVGLRACYDEGKRFAEALTMEYVRKHNLDARIVRIFNTYGPRMQKDDGRVVSNFINQAIAGISLTIYGDGTQTRSFCYISDMVNGIIAAMESKDMIGEVVNLGNPNELTIEEIGEIILKLTNSKSSMEKYDERIGDDPDKRKPDIEKAMKKLHWEPQIDLETGLNKTIEYFKNL